MMQNKNLILLATYWNEIEWVEASLDQIEKIKPIEAIICDGNFDPRVENQSTDGTHQVLSRYVKEASVPVRLISAIRLSSNLFKGWRLFNASGCTSSLRRPIARLRQSISSQRATNEYRVNQALTFAYMCRIAGSWQNDRWVMTYDADQFYTDDLIDVFSIVNDKRCGYDLITADELTFPYSFKSFTRGYELRKWHNMPHRIKSHMAVYPTRHFVIEKGFNVINFQDHFKTFHGGSYHHYKFRRDQTRLSAGYQLGDRKPPDPKRYDNLEDSIKLRMPEVIKKRFGASIGGIK